MSDNLSKKIVRDTFEKSFDKEQFTLFIKNLLNHIDDTSEGATFVYRGQLIPEVYRDSISGLERIGKYTDPEGKKVELLIVNLKKDNSLDRARTLQRNFVAWYLDGSRGGILKDAALVAFVSPDLNSWRFSLVKMDYKIQEAKVKKDLTPAKRYSFLVGSQEKSHTAQSRLVPIIADDVNDPTLKQLEEAFNIEKVTKEFFEKYRDLFIRLKESLDEIVSKNKKIRDDFDKKNLDTTSFAKKLLGQIVFLYFLQKKGWFGVERDSDWGTGPKNFLRELFDKKKVPYKNFFNNVLEPLFYEALAKKRDKDFYNHLNCKIPFLNGGLFDPINDYDWVYTDINIDNELFSNEFKTKEGDIGTGILDVFDRYNFTVREDEPLEKEVAVDPEMLGKVFENLLEVKDRKSKGTYYTPREIVHYMCQESLINYLHSELTELGHNISKENLNVLVKKGASLIHNDQSASSGKKKYEEHIPKSIKKLAPLIDLKLTDIKVCDPAVGSGAFLVGMMNEIVSCREVLWSLQNDTRERDTYKFKRDAIQHSLYGVDIDPSAVEVAKLRLWLSLVVEEDDIKKIKPLPNLDYKIMQGNSLLEEFKGVKLFDEKLLTKNKTVEYDTTEELKQKELELGGKLLPYYQKNPNWMKNKAISRPPELAMIEMEMDKVKASLKKNNSKAKELIIKPLQVGLNFLGSIGREDVWLKLKKLYGIYFKSYDIDKKKSIRNSIEKVIWELIETTIKEEGKLDTLKEIEVYKNNGIRPFFLWKLYFADVFQEKGGFDVVIGNPPWEKVKPQDPEFFRLYEPDYRKKSKAVQAEIKKKLLEKASIKKEYDFFISSRIQTMESAAKNFNLQGSSDSNYYKLFVEKSLEISSSSVCWVIPGSITIDEGSNKMRNYLIENNLIDKILGFSNKEGVFEWIDNNQKFMVLSIIKDRRVTDFSILGWLNNAQNLDSLEFIKIKNNFYESLDPSNLTFYLDTNRDSFVLLSKFLKDKKIDSLKKIGFHYWQEYHATNDSAYFNDLSGKHKLISGKVIDQFDCMSKSWLEDHGRSSKWKKLGFPKDEKAFRTEYYVSEVPDRIKNHHLQEESSFRIVIQNVTGTINNLRTVYACVLHKKFLTNNSLHNLYIGDNDEELFYYLGILNSFVLDWQARIKVATNLNKFILESFFMPDFKLADKKLRSQVSSISFWLSNVNDDFKNVKGNFSKEKFESREEAVIALNILVAKLYGLDKNEFKFVLSYFGLVNESFVASIINECKE